MKTQYLSAKEVTAELGISFGTLYSYVSRGLIRSEEIDGSTRHKRYLAEDVETLRNRRERRRNPSTSAATALDFGDPVLESGITLIENGNLYYRGQVAVELARKHTAEEVAGFLWTGHPDPELMPLPSVAPGLDLLLPSLLSCLPDSLTPMERFHVLLPIAEAHDLAAHDKTLAGVCRTAGRIYALLVHAVIGDLPEANDQSNFQSNANETGAYADSPQDDERLAQRLLRWGQPQMRVEPNPSTAKLLDAALILCADHELNASSFTARCVASTGSTPYGAVAAALAALQGPRHGGDTARCEMLIREARTNPRQALAAWLRRGESLPGFGHRLYPKGDPRARFLLAQLHAQTLPDPQAGRVLKTVDGLIHEVEATFGLRPTIDLALASISLALNMPQGAGLTLFATGRIMGWIAHIIEQYQTDALIRPRAHYTGPMP